MTDPRGMTREELQAHVDGELGATRLAEVETLLRDDPALANAAALFRTDKMRLAKIYGGLADRPLPRHWLARIEEPPASHKLANWWPAAAAAAAALVLLVVGSTEPFFTPAGDTIVADAMAARDNSLAAKETIAVSASSGGAAANRILASALEMRAKAPDLERLGYTLAAIRIYSQSPRGNAIELVYRGKKDEPVTLYVKHLPGEPKFDQFVKDGLRGCIWQDDTVAMVMLGKMSAPEMQRLASQAYTGLES